ncbi:hypothetical protein PG987_006108 [Apiospora arundinis]
MLWKQLCQALKTRFDAPAETNVPDDEEQHDEVSGNVMQEHHSSEEMDEQGKCLIPVMKPAVDDIQNAAEEALI